MRRIAILDAPSNLGLRPPTETSVPGCAKAPGALRDHGLVARLGARDAGCLTPPRYDPGDWRPGDGVCHAPQIAGYSRRLADRIGAILDAGEFPVVLGGDCSIVLGSGLAMHRLGEAVGGRIGLVFVDGHSDFRHPGNASYVGAAAGEDLALVTGRGQADLAAIEGRRPYFRDVDVVVLGIRAQDEYRLDLQAAGIVTRPVPALRAEGAARSAQWARDQLVDCAGYWVHVDMDVLDPAVMPAVDAPSPGGIAFPELEILLAGLVDTPHCLGVEITVFDPDYDTDGSYAKEITSAIVAGLTPVRTAAALRPPPDAGASDEGHSGNDPEVSDDVVPAEDLPAPADLGESASGYAAHDPAEPADGNQLHEPRAVTVAVTELDEAGVDDEVVPAVDGFTITETDVLPTASADRAATADVLASADFASAAEFAASADAVSPAEGDAGDEAAALAEGDAHGEADIDSPLSAEAGISTSADLHSSPVTAAAEAEVAAAGFESSVGRAEAEAPTTGLRSPSGTEPRVAGAGLDSSSIPTAEVEVPAAGLDAPSATTTSAPSATTADALTATAADAPPATATSAPPATTAEALSAATGGTPEASAVADEAAAEDPEEPASDHRRIPVTRPLGQAPLLDSKPLPATRPGMLRPRPAPAEDDDSGFSLPAQRPAFDAGTGEPADVT